MSGLLELAARCERAEGPDRELDLEIEKVVAPGVKSPLDPLPAFTASFDAAMTLVPEEWAIARFSVWPGEPSSLDLLETRRVGDQWVRGAALASVEASAAAAPLALCAAALKARARKETSQ